MASITFTPDQFTSLETVYKACSSGHPCGSAADKAAFANCLVAFVEKGYPESAFTNYLYSHLNISFGHIAHFDRHTFYQTWFSTEEAQNDWVDHVGRWRSFGDESYTMRDVEVAFRTWLMGRRG